MTLAVVEKTLPMATITGRTERRTDRVRRNMRPPPREEGLIITQNVGCCYCAQIDYALTKHAQIHEKRKIPLLIASSHILFTVTTT